MASLRFHFSASKSLNVKEVFLRLRLPFRGLIEVTPRRSVTISVNPNGLLACFGESNNRLRCSSFYKLGRVQQVRLLSTSKTLSRKVGDLPHFNKDGTEKDQAGQEKRDKSYILPHPIWSSEDLHNVQITHNKPETWVDEMAYVSVQTLRILFDIFSMYKIGRMSEDKWLTRIIMLETLAGVPGMVGAMVRHFNSLRRMTRDHGWIHTLLEDAENERMHLMTYLELKNPGKLFRFTVILAQGVMVNLLFLAYLLSPKFVHRFVGYLEEEAVKTYTFCLECLDKGRLPMWEHLKAPEIAKNYWELGENAMMRDVLLATRADEAHHRLVNHTLASMPYDKQNPFMPGQKKL